MVLECCGPSLYDYVKVSKYRPFHTDTILSISYQLMSSLHFLHTKCKCVHTDLKLENILFKSTDIRVMDTNNHDNHFSNFNSYNTISNSTNNAAHMYIHQPFIKLIDFGGATFEDDHHASIINTRQYRGPEAILGCGWSYPSDVWSAGCILFELCKGRLLFETHDNHEHLALMQRLLGAYPSMMSNHHYKKYPNKYFAPSGGSSSRSSRSSSSSSRSSRSSRSTTQGYHQQQRPPPPPSSSLQFIWPAEKSDQESINHVNRMQPLPLLSQKYNTGNALKNILSKMLILDPQERCTAHAIVHDLSSALFRCTVCQTMEQNRQTCTVCQQQCICIGCSQVSGYKCGCDVI